MKVPGILTKNFSLYHDVVEGFRKRGVGVASLEFGRPLPPGIAAVIASRSDGEAPDFPDPLFIEDFSSIESLIDAALLKCGGSGEIRELVIGIDPGELPGIAVYGNRVLLKKENARSPEEVRPVVERLLCTYHADRVVVRIGHGARILRNRTINALSGMVPIELVNEQCTTPARGEIVEQRDSDAAAAIALGSGREVSGEFSIVPNAGEIRDMQRKSRLVSEGEFTISKKLAARVLGGELSLDEAVELCRRKENP
ncbi:MAG: hypothetical protein CVT48_03935 [Thermoplasmata archaeon HGW-Thermoplasmata-1]|nr:MAG: hypothetical protein CVT48_03935 [Thermoplasmata archaeon HGW-Thermoplasmata-1]